MDDKLDFTWRMVLLLVASGMLVRYLVREHYPKAAILAGHRLEHYGKALQDDGFNRLRRESL